MKYDKNNVKVYTFAKVMFIFLFMNSCMEYKSTDPVESYQLWSGQKPTSEVIVINGQYWQLIGQKNTLRILN
ncbi:hypothetical protein CH373_06090 [Leptospira perolatii]|uniref:Uncharacterized protein n=1 Tax=Leptospira perolatii TaxID=2023191 RepID=A0A2M9ZP81_9LEPT|nr:hypothetical protein CH360_04820 [Leptospira perolatii]PJZ73733.1 hypothetical protein CH373_06090 [Leptospira perolatii]